MSDDLPIHVSRRRESGVFSGRSMPELLHGECVMRRRIDLAYEVADPHTFVVWRRAALAVTAAIIAVMLISAFLADRYA